MCKPKKQKRIDVIKEKLSQSKETLEQNLKRGDETLCEYLKNIITGHHANITPTDGIQNDRK